MEIATQPTKWNGSLIVFVILAELIASISVELN